MHQDRVLQMFVKIYKKIGENWPKFIADLKTKTTADEPNLILIKNFSSVLLQYGLKLTEDQETQIKLAFPRGQVGQDIRINIAMLFE